MRKRGNITSFIIVGVVIVVFALIVFFIASLDKNTVTKIQDTSLSEKEPVESFVQGCVDKTCKQALLLLGAQGGYLSEPINSINVEDYFISYAYYEGENLLLDKDRIQEDISDYVKQNLNICFNNFEDFHSDIELGELLVDTKINSDNVEINIDYPIKLIGIDITKEFNEFKSIVPVRLDYILTSANEIIESEINDPNWINFGMLSVLDIDTEILYYEDDVIYVLEDSKSQINNKNYTFVFANKFKENIEPDLFTFGDQEIEPGKELIVKARAIDFEDDEIAYSGPDLLSINEKTGIIKFTAPNIKGNYQFIIRATDSYGNYDEEQLLVKVI